jgi:hypothetical protein
VNAFFEPSIVREEIFIEPLELKKATGADANRVLDHERFPSIRMTRYGILDANSIACAAKVEVVTNTPFEAFSPTKLPVKAWISGRLTAFPGA